MMSEGGDTRDSNSVGVNTNISYSTFNEKLSGILNGNGVSYRIGVIGHYGGGTEYENKNNEVGTSHIFEVMRKKPDMLIISGGVLPEIPYRGKESYKNKLRIRNKGGDNLDDEASIVRPGIARMLSKLPKSTEVVYVMDSEDKKNIDNMVTELGNEFNMTRKYLRAGKESPISAKIEEIKIEIENLRSIVKSTAADIKGYEDALTKADDSNKKALERSIEEGYIDIRINRERIADLTEQKAMLEDLLWLAIPNVEVSKIMKQMSNKKKEYRKVNKEISSESTSPERRNELTKEAKKLASELEVFGHRLKEAVQRGVEFEKMNKFSGMESYIGTNRLPPYVLDKIDAIARAMYIYSLKEAFGRQHSIKIQEKEIDVYEKGINGSRIAVIPANFELNSDTIKAGENTAFNSKLHRKLKNSGLLKNINADYVVAVGAHTGYTTFEVDLYENLSGKMLVSLSPGVFYDVKKAAEIYSYGVKSKDTAATDKMLMDSGVNIIDIGKDHSIKHTKINDELLTLSRIAKENDDAEKEAAARIIKRLSENPKSIEGVKPKLEEAKVEHKLPTEIKEREIPFVKKEKILPYEGASIPEIKEIKIAAISDVHIGNFAALDVFKASIADMIQKKADVLAILGDVFEGNYKKYKDVVRDSYNLNYVDLYEKWLIEKGVDENEINRRINAINKQLRMQNAVIDDQVLVFIEIAKDAIVDVIKRGGVILIASGNHKNQTEEGWQYDEAREIRNAIIGLLKGEDLPNGYENQIRLPDEYESGIKDAEWYDRKIKIAGGSEWGADIFIVDGIRIEVRHSVPKSYSALLNFEERRRGGADIILSGDLHQIADVSAADFANVRAPSMQDSFDNPFGKVIAMPRDAGESLRGYSLVKVNYIPEADRGKIVAYSHEPILREQLHKKDELYAAYRMEKKRAVLSTHR